MPFGLNMSPETFQKLSEQVFGDIDGVIVYIDDVLVFGKSEQEHDDAVKEVLNRKTKIIPLQREE